MNVWLKSLLALAALVVIGFGGILGFVLLKEVWRDVSRGVATSGVVNVDPANDTIVERRYLADFGRVGDGPVSRATLYVAQDFDVGAGFGIYAKSSGDNAVNMLFLEPGAPDRWLFPDNGQLIVESRPLSLSPPGPQAQDQPDIALMLRVVRADTNADQRLSGGDASSLALIRPDGRRMVTLIETLDGTVVQVPDPKEIVLSIGTATNIDLLRIDPASFAILDRRTIDFPD